MHGLLCDARKLTHVSYLRRDPLVPELLGIKRVASQSVLTRFFQGFTSAGGNLRCFRPLWHWGLDRLPSQKEGYTLDLDSTRLLHKDGHQEGVAVRLHQAGNQALSASAPGGAGRGAVGGATVVAARQQPPAATTSPRSFWTCGTNLPRHIRLRGVRADSGFCLPELLACGSNCSCLTWWWRN